MIYVQKFCSTIRNRSAENQVAISLMFSNKLYSNSLSILRQELDLMVRVIYILGITDEGYRERLLKDFVEGKRWKRKSSNDYITDKEMVDFTNKLFGYTRLVYQFGCRFIHLSNLQNWLDEDVSNNLSFEIKRDIVKYINQYHTAGLKTDFTFNNIIMFIPDIFEKIHGNLECYIQNIEEGKFGLSLI